MDFDRAFDIILHKLHFFKEKQYCSFYHSDRTRTSAHPHTHRGEKTKRKTNEDKTDAANSICVGIILSAWYLLLVFHRNIIIDENHESHILFVIY